MPKFDIWSTPSQSLTAIKVKKAQESNQSGSVYLTTLTSSTKKAAEKQAETRLQSGLIKFPSSKSFSADDIKNSPVKSLIKPETVKKGIYCDVNGVLDDISIPFDFNASPSFSVPKVACPHKIMKLTKLALKHNAELIMISLWRKDIDFRLLIGRCLLNCEIQEYVDFYNENRRDINALCRTYPTEHLGERTDEVRYHINENEYSHFVVFEDQHPIDSDLNLIRTQTSIGLLDKHIEEADIILSKAFD